MTNGDKATWRTFFVHARATLTEADRSADAAALTTHMVTAALEARNRTGCATVAAYVATQTEPGSLDALYALHEADMRVVLPVTAPGNTLDWAEYQGPQRLVRGAYGLLEPAGPRLGVEVLESCCVIFVPALGVGFSGERLGRGAGYYDRALAGAGVAAQRVAIVRDEEFVPELPYAEHDVMMDAVITPGRGYVSLPIKSTN
ncbi:5-formyltetrahydrofolate cyclo-ligase [Hoyosella rhizosphaerae]|uniref:5-formyltetrahydrofolate cyclo-ligase n=1 Tax=Hoyosella rhizosphaerae TaxID=1755582 RepID=A0A916UDM5_9ACTN|nr:5-formyltetrahydrofolate cyclo-ligase [Hoyosella rhizosphaerae]MBN4925779.1 5-formyltetrahydrofolate cyclo-ligase [Hoyosella rhizosphaerae]GGC68034.1 5-formyltetrahydrofolate cyclo-ligase [Hoyosella rhizosphaerae]